MSDGVDVAIIGAGPYGLAAAAHLRHAGRATRVFGEPVQFWRTQTPVGMLLRSPYRGSDIGDPRAEFSFPAYASRAGLSCDGPIPADTFCAYGEWFARRVLPDLDRRDVKQVERTSRGFRVVLAEGESYEARRVVVAAGVGTFAWKPPVLADLDPSVASHTLDHRDLRAIRGPRVSVIGGGQSALESAALLAEAGFDVDVLMRAPATRWLGQHSWAHDTWPLRTLLYSAPDVGPAGVSQLVARPALYRRMPRALQDRLAVRSVRPAGAGWLHPRLAEVPIHTGVSVRSATRAGGRVSLELDNGRTQTVDHVLLGTGYRVDLARYSFLPGDLVAAIDCTGGYPRLSTAFETSVPGLHIIGAPAAWRYGPLMRFVAGSNFAGRTLARAIGS